MATSTGLVSPQRGLAPSNSRSAIRAAVASVLAITLACCVMSYTAGSAKDDVALLSEASSLPTTGTGEARTTSLTGIISSAEEAMNALRHSVLSDKAQTTLPLGTNVKTEDLLKTAMQEQVQDSYKSRNPVDEQRWKEASDHTSKSAISHALTDVAKATGKGHGLDHSASDGDEAQQDFSAEQHEAHGDNTSKRSGAWGEAADHTSKSAISHALMDIAKAKKENIQGPMDGTNHGDGGGQHSNEQEEAADHTSKSTMSHALRDIAKVTKEGQGMEDSANNGGGHSKDSKELEEATDQDHGMVSKANMQLAAKLKDEMNKEGDRARAETIDGGSSRQREADEAEDMDHRKVSEQQFVLFKNALKEQEGKWDEDPSKVEQEAEMEQHKDTMLASEHERVDK